MKKISLIAILFFLFIAGGCNKDNSDSLIIQPNYQNDLQKLADDHWDRFAEGKVNFPGGYALQIFSPVGDYFVSTGDLSSFTTEPTFGEPVLPKHLLPRPSYCCISKAS